MAKNLINGWEEIKLNECFSLASGSSRPEDIISFQTDKKSVPVYGGNGILGYTSNVFSEETNIIIGRVGEKCGCIYIVQGPHWITDNALYTKNWKIEANIYYFTYLLEYLKISRLRNKGGQPLISQKPIHNIKIILPPNIEQNAIAEILSCWDQAIDQTDQLIKAKEKQKIALMQQLLTGKRRFKEFIKSPKLNKSKYFKYPDDWLYCTVGSFATEVNKRNNGGKEVTVLSCTKHDGLVDSLEYFNKRIFSEDTSNYKVVCRGQFAYATNHIEEGSIGLLKYHEKGLVSPMYTVFKTDDRVYVPFLYKVFKTELYRHIFSVNTNASVNRRGSLRWKGFAKIKVALPSYDEQIKISACLDVCDDEIRLLKEQTELFQKQKQGLMQKLLTGKIRVKV